MSTCRHGLWLWKVPHFHHPGQCQDKISPLQAPGEQWLIRGGGTGPTSRTGDKPKTHIPAGLRTWCPGSPGNYRPYILSLCAANTAYFPETIPLAGTVKPLVLSLFLEAHPLPRGMSLSSHTPAWCTAPSCWLGHCSSPLFSPPACGLAPGLVLPLTYLFFSPNHCFQMDSFKMGF